MVYDVGHNIAKFESLELDGQKRRVCVHRKGATRAYPAGHPQTPAAYCDVGQPVIIPGDMVRYSYVMAGTARASVETFGSSCHGARRRLSCAAAKRSWTAQQVMDDLAERGVVLKAAGMGTVAGQMPLAYKDVGGDGWGGHLDPRCPTPATRRHKGMIIRAQL